MQASQDTVPKSPSGRRTTQTGLVRGFWVLCPGLPVLEGHKKRNISKCEELVTWGRDRKRSSTHSPHCQSARCAVPSFAQQSPGPKKSETHTEEAKKLLLRGVGPGNRKKNSRLVAGFEPIMTLLSSSFQSTSYHWKNFFPSTRFAHLAQKTNGYYGRYY